jgi:hypothetical protein
MIEAENENPVPEPEPGPDADVTADSVPDKMEYPDPQELLVEGDKPADSNSAAAPNAIVVETRSATADLPRVPPTGQPGGNHASRSPGHPEDREKSLTGVISRIERLENWVKTNRLG